ncbi:UNVERIFIED_CONTAM: hypothetical protein PYX00_010315 [Menopon gallinae]
MHRFLVVTLLVFLSTFATEAADVISQHDVDPAEIDYQNATVVNLKSIKIQEIPKNYFKDLNLDLSLLRIVNSNLQRIDEHAFDGLDHLNLLELSNDKITRLEPKTFANLKGLELLQLKSNRLRDVSLVLNNVQEIGLARNEISEIRKDFLSGNSIAFIDLSWNQIDRLEHSMKSLVNLDTIKISENAMTEIEPRVFAENKNLFRIYASGNMLKSTDGLKVKQLRTLDISSNKFTRLENDSFAGMVFLEQLLLNGNMISEIDDAFAELTNLLYLDLSDNMISEIDPGMFRNNQYLTKLELSKNKLTELKPFKRTLRHLTVLDLSHNFLESIDNSFFQWMDKLEILNLSFNRLTSIGDSLRPLTSLVSLDLSSNSLEFGADTIRSNVKLHNLNISSNGLDLKLSYLANNSQLKNVDLSNNNITDFCDLDFSLNVFAIDLSNNRISNLNCFKKNILPFAIIDIRQNPLSCDQDFDDVIAHFILMNASPYNIRDSHNLTTSFQIMPNLWNSVKREICPKGLDINIKDVTDLHERFGKAMEEENSQYLDDSYDHAYYYDYGHFVGVLDDDIETKESTEHNDEEVPLENDIVIGKLSGDARDVEQSQRKSWVTITGTEYEDFGSFTHVINKSHLSLFTISMIFIGVSLLLVVVNVTIFLFVRMKWRKKDFRGPQKYTHLENKVYKDTTVPNDYSSLVGKKSDNYRMNCERMCVNFGFQGTEDDTESVKKMIVDETTKAEV